MSPVVDSFITWRHNQRSMNMSTLFLVALCYPLAAYGQSGSSAQVQFAGCYQITSQKRHPLNEDDVPIPGSFQLRSEPVDNRSTDILQMRSIPARNNSFENLWVWRPKGNSLWLSWGTGLGGFRGTLKQSRTGDFAGKVKEWCDSRCGWKRRVATIRIQKTPCTQ